MADGHVIYFDEERARGSHADNVLEKYLAENNVDLIVNAAILNLQECPSIKALRKAQSKGVKVAYLWFDTVVQESIPGMCVHAPEADLNIVIDQDEATFPLARYGNFICLWQPVDTRVYHQSGEPKTIDASFVGWVQQYHERRILLGALQATSHKVFVGGGQREKFVSDEEFVRIIQQSKLSINFSSDATTGKKWQFKGRVFEIIFNGTMLLDNLNYHTSRFFEAGKEYVGFTNEKDFLEKVNYYIAHDVEREEIAARAYKKAVDLYSPRRYWERVFGKLGIPY